MDTENKKMKTNNSIIKSLFISIQYDSILSTCNILYYERWNGNDILSTFSTLTLSEIVNMTITGAANDEYDVRMTT